MIMRPFSVISWLYPCTLACDTSIKYLIAKLYLVTNTLFYLTSLWHTIVSTFVVFMPELLFFFIFACVYSCILSSLHTRILPGDFS